MYVVQSKSNWVSRTTRLIQSLNLNEESLCDSNATWKAIIDAEMSDWNCQMHTIPIDSESGGRLNLYRKLKLEPQPENYILRTISLDKRRTIAQLRSGCFPLEVELGRYRTPKTPLNQRICQLCDTHITEDEKHFLTTCPSLQEARIPLFCEMSKLEPSFSTLHPDEQTVLIYTLILC